VIASCISGNYYPHRLLGAPGRKGEAFRRPIANETISYSQNLIRVWLGIDAVDTFKKEDLNTSSYLL
jgi:hypothetical protein